MSEMEAALAAAIEEWDRTRRPNEQRRPFSAGFRVGWAAAFAADGPNMVLVDRQHLAQLEEIAALWRAAGGL